MIGIKHVLLFFFWALSLQMSYSLVGSSIPRTEWSYRLNPCDNPTWHWKSMETRHILIRLQWWILRNIHRRYILDTTGSCCQLLPYVTISQATISAAIGVFFKEGTQEPPWPLDSKQLVGSGWEWWYFWKVGDTQRLQEILYPIFDKWFFERWILVVQDLSTIDHPFGMLPMKSANQPTVVPCYPPKLWSNGNSQSRHVL